MNDCCQQKQVMKGFQGGSVTLLRLDDKPKKCGMLSGPELSLSTWMFSIVLRLKLGSCLPAFTCAPCLFNVCLQLFSATKGGTENGFTWGTP